MDLRILNEEDQNFVTKFLEEIRKLPDWSAFMVIFMIVNTSVKSKK